jgi:hypothetical protein
MPMNVPFCRRARFRRNPNGSRQDSQTDRELSREVAPSPPHLGGSSPCPTLGSDRILAAGWLLGCGASASRYVEYVLVDGIKSIDPGRSPHS